MSGAGARAGWGRLVVVGALLGLAAVAESVARAVDTGASTWFGLVLGLLSLAGTLPVVHPRPVPAALVLTSASVLSLALFHGVTVAGLGAQLVVLYRLGRTGAPVLAGVLAASFLVLALVDATGSASAARVVLLAALAPAAALTGAVLAARAEALVHRSARQAVADALLEHTARGERARIARELHDVVAHHISMIAVQAETARLTTPGLPAAGARRFTEIGDTARAGLTEMRRLLGVLRADVQPEVADRRPQPGLHHLVELLDEARDTSGAGARLIVTGAPVALDPGVELAAYRIVQEALTNTRRHAPGAAVDVELYYAEDALLLRVRDNGSGPAGTATATGHGLAGMRERAAALGGELRAGPAPVGGFLVEATLPVRLAVAR